MNNFRNRLYFRQAARVTAVALILGLLFSLTQIAVDFRNERNAIDGTVAQVLESLRTPASQAAFSLSKYLAVGVTESLLKYQPIYSATIFTETGETLATRSHPRTPSRMSWLADKLTIGEGEYTLPLYAEGMKKSIGKVVVQVDATLIAGNFLTRAGLTLLFGFLKNMVLALAVCIVFFYTLSRPLSRLSSALALGGTHHSETALNLDPADYGDSEMGELLASANRFLENQVAARTAALQQQNAELKRLTAAVENSPVAVVMTDTAGRIIYVNPRFESMSGYRAEEIAVQSICIWQYMVDDVREDVLYRLQEKGFWRGELQGRRKDGSTYWQEVAVAAIRGEKAGDDLYEVWVLEDITDRKAAELALQAAKHEAEQATRAKSEFLANMSHELRTPLNAVLGYAQILKHDKGLSERQVNGLNTIERSGEHLLMLINDILDLSKIEAGKFELYPSAVNLPAFTQVIGDIVRVKAEEKSLLFTCETAPDLPRTVEVDDKRLRQVLLNLLGNAVKFTSRGKVSLRVRLLSINEEQARLSFEIQDTGVGMKEADIATIFKPFEQVGEMQRRAGGTGLGLAISWQLVHLMGSEIRVKSRPDEGSLFWFEVTLPVIAAEIAAPSPERMVIGYEGRRRKVLIIDDVVANRAMLVDLMAELGFQTCEARDGQKGLEQAQAEQPDLIITDVTMPVMDGLEATRRMRQIPVLREVPIIAVSASTSQRDNVASLDAGANAFLAKPIDQQRLLQQIGAYLGLAWVYEESQESAVQKDDGEKDELPMITPPQMEMEILHTLAMMGNMRDIHQQADHIAALGEQYRPFADKLRVLAKGYQSKAILGLVKKHMESR